MKATLEKDDYYDGRRTCCQCARICIIKAWEATYIFFCKFYIISYLQSFATLIKFLCKELVHYLYQLCCIKKEKIIATYVETGESPTKGQVGMKISYRHDFDSHSRFRELYEWRDATIVDRQCFGKGVKIRYDAKENIASSPKRWVTVTPNKMKWRSKVEKKYGVRKELAKYKKDIQTELKAKD